MSDDTDAFGFLEANEFSDETATVSVDHATHGECPVKLTIDVNGVCVGVNLSGIDAVRIADDLREHTQDAEAVRGATEAYRGP